MINTASLYETDILLWVEDTVAKLRARDFAHVDWENVIEEIDALGISQRKELLSHLTRLLEHLLQRLSVPSELDYNGWERTIRHQRLELGILLDHAPSLRAKWAENFDNAWRRTLANLQEEYPQIQFPEIQLPEQWPYASDAAAMLTVKFWQLPTPSLTPGL